MNTQFKQILSFGILAEVLILVGSYLLQPTIEDTFRYAARYSGRLSFAVFFYSFYLFASAHPQPIRENQPLRNFLQLFAVLHLIHFVFLALSVYLNAIPLEVPKVIGGALAYLMIVAAPFRLHRIKFSGQLVFFYYVSFVMIMTFVARIKGELEGADPHWIHYVGIGIAVLCGVLFGWWLRKGTRT